MNAVVALCHFCEMHGPTVVTCTQPVHRNNIVERNEERRWGDEYGDGHRVWNRGSFSAGSDTESAEIDSFDALGVTDEYTCSACRSFGRNSQGIVTYGESGTLSYITLQQPFNQEIFAILRQACLRSLSSENTPGREGPLFFGDDHHGYVYSFTFSLKDNEARGMQRWFSIVVLSMDKITMTQSWPFFTRCFRPLVAKLQAQAEKTFNSDQTEKPQRTLRLGSTSENFRMRRGKALRSLTDITADPNVFSFLHEQFTLLIQLGGNQMYETLLEGGDCCNFPSLADNMRNTEIGSATSLSPEQDVFERTPTISPALPGLPTFRGLCHFYKFAGKANFRRIAYHTVIGTQMIVRGFHDFLVGSAVKALETLLPTGCRHSSPYSPVYIEGYRCNMLGLNPETTLPDTVLGGPEYFVIDILAAKMNEMDIDKYRVILPSQTSLPSQLPSYLSRIETILGEPEMAEEAAQALIMNLQERVMTKVKILYKLFRTEQRGQDQLASVSEKLHIPSEDHEMMKFWMTALKTEYKSHLTELSLPAYVSGGSINEPASRKSSQMKRGSLSTIMRGK